MDSHTSATPLKRSHSPDQDVLQAPSPPDQAKRSRTNQRPELADAFLECLSSSDLIHIIRQLEQLLQDTPYLADAYALIYPENLEEHTSMRQQASVPTIPTTQPLLRTSSEPPSHAPETSTPSMVPVPSLSTHTPHISSPLASQPVQTQTSPPSTLLTTASPLPSRLYTPSIPASVSDTTTPSLNTESLVTPPGTEPESASNNSNISSRIAAILESIQSTNSSGPMLGLQGQPLAPSKQGAGTGVSNGLSSLLSNSFPHSSARMPANSALSRLLEQSSTSATPPASTALSTSSPSSSVLSNLASRTGFSTTPSLDYTSFSHPTTSVTGSATTSSPLSPFTSTYGLHDTHSEDGNAPQRESPRITSTLPSYEDMIIEGLQVIGDVNGTPPRMLFHWMEDTYPLMKNFRPSASQALQKAFKRGRLHKAGSLYRINPHWDGSNAGRKPTRRPQIGKDHPMMVNGPKGPAPASPFKARAQFEGAAAYRQSSVHLNKHRNLRHPSSLRPGPKPYGQPGAAPLDNPASSIFQNGAAAAALLLAHQQRTRDSNGNSPGLPTSTQDLTPTLTSLVKQLRGSSATPMSDGPGSSSLSSVLASALLKHVQRPSDGSAAVSDPSMLTPLTNSLTSTSSPVLQSLSRLLSASRADPSISETGDATTKPTSVPYSTSPASSLPASGPGSLSASIETLVRQATRTATQQAESSPSSAVTTGPMPSEPSSSTAPQLPPPSTSQSDLDAAVSQTLQAAFQQLGPDKTAASVDSGDAMPDSNAASALEGIDTSELDGINLDDYGDALRTLTAALAGTSAEGEEGDEEAQRLADEKAIADAEADLSDVGESEEDLPKSSSHGQSKDTNSSNRMESLLRSYGIDVSSEAVHHLTETLRDPNMSVSELTEHSKDKGPNDSVQDKTPVVPSATDESTAVPGTSTDLSLLDPNASDADKNQSIQTQLEALIASLAAENEES